MTITRHSALMLLALCAATACAHAVSSVSHGADASTAGAPGVPSCPPANPVADTTAGQVRRFSPGGHLDRQGRQFFYEFEVARTATVHKDSPLPAAVGQGTVLAQFMVDTAGRVEPGTWRIVRASDSTLAHAVLAALPTMRFTPAEQHAGCRVRQFVQMPFNFR